MLDTLQKIRSAHESTGGLWFDPSTLEWWDSVFSTLVLPVDGGAYFLSRETNPSDVKMWTVRHATDAGEITTVGEFFAYETQEEAWTAAKAAAGHVDA